jgi:hypothetical protein
MWTPCVQRPTNPVPVVGWLKRISNYRLLRKLGFSHEVARSRCRYNCDYLRKKPRHRRWFVSHMLSRHLREVQ